MGEQGLCGNCKHFAKGYYQHLPQPPWLHCHHPKEVKESWLKPGMKVRIKNASSVGQDFSFCKWKEDGTIFTVKEIRFSTGRVCLTAPGYGDPTPNYGNGAIYVKPNDLIPAEEVKPCKWCEAWGEWNNSLRHWTTPLTPLGLAVKYLITRGGQELKNCPECGKSL